MKKFTQKLGKRITAMALVLLMLTSSSGVTVFADEMTAVPAPTASTEPAADAAPAEPAAEESAKTEPGEQTTPEPAEQPAPEPETTSAAEPEQPATEPTDEAVVETVQPTPEPVETPAATETPAPTEAPEATATPEPTATATPAPTPTAPPAANGIALLNEEGEDNSGDSDDTAANSQAADMVNLTDVALGDDITFRVTDNAGNPFPVDPDDPDGGAQIPDDAEFTIQVTYTIDNAYLYLIDSGTTLYYDFPAALVLNGVGADYRFEGNLTDSDYVGVPGTYTLAWNEENQCWRLSFQYTDAYLAGRSSLTGGFTFRCEISEEVTSTEEEIVLDFGGEGHSQPIQLDKPTIIAEKTYTDNINDDGTVTFNVSLDVNKLSENVQITDTMGAAFAFQDPAVFTLTGPNNYNKTFSTADGTATLSGNTVTLQVGELAGGDYTLTYTANVVERASDAATEEKQNTVSVTLNGNGSSDTIEVDWKDEDNWLNKTGAISAADANGLRTITWTIKLNDSYPRMDLSSMTLTDSMSLAQGTGVTYTNPHVTVTNADTNAEYTNGTLTTNNGGFSYTFGDDAGTSRYTVVYTVQVDEKNLADGGYKVHNDVTLTKDGKKLEEDDADVIWTVGHNATVAFKGTKTVHGALPSAKEFTFKLYKATNSQFAYNEENLLDTVTVSVGENGKKDITFEEITYDKGDADKTFYYVIEEVVPADKVDGVTYDTTKWYITVEVTQGNDGNLSAAVTSSTSTEDAGTEWDGASNNLFAFTNTYESVTGTIPVQKTVTGEGAAEGTYTFDLYEKEDEHASVGENDKPVSSVSVTASKVENEDGTSAITGTGNLQLPTYYATDFDDDEHSKTYYYLLKENREPAVAGLTYDTTEYNVAVTVSKPENGSLTISNISISVVPDSTNTGSTYEYNGTLENLASDNPIPFVNTYDETTVDFGGTKTLIGAELEDHADDFHFTIDRVYLDKTTGKYVAYVENEPEHYKEQVDLLITTDESGKVGTFNFSEITYTAEDTYYYTVTEQVDQDSNCKGNTNGYFITVVVAKVNNKLVPTVTVKPLDTETNGPVTSASDVDPHELNFVNVYQGVGIGITGNKIVNGNYSSVAGYKFKLQKYVRNDAGAWVASGQAQEATSDSDSRFSFALDYTADDLNGNTSETYYYSITEVDTGNNNTTYDDTVYWVRVILSLNTNDTLNVQCDLVEGLGSKVVKQGGTLDANGNVTFGDSATGTTGTHQGIYFTNTVYTAADLPLQANKTLTIADSATNRPGMADFQFKLERVDVAEDGTIKGVLTEGIKEEENQIKKAGNEQSVADSKTFTGTVAFDTITYTYAQDHGKTYYYRVSEVKGNDSNTNANPHTMYSDAEYYVKVFITTDDTDQYKLVAKVTPMVLVDNKLEEDTSEGAVENNFPFSNTYVYHEVKVDLNLTGSKDVYEDQGTFPTDDITKFAFVLYDANNDVKKIVNADADGNITFSGDDFFTFTTAGEKTFYLRELDPTDPDDVTLAKNEGVTLQEVKGIITYDPTVYKIVYTVDADNDGKLTCSDPVITKEPANAVQGLVNFLQGTDTTVANGALNFTNTFDEKALPPTVEIEKTAGNVSYKDGTVNWTLDVTVSDLKQGAPLDSLIITDIITTTGTNVQETVIDQSSIEVVELSKDKSQVVQEDLPYTSLLGTDGYENYDLAIQVKDTIDYNHTDNNLVDHVYRITYTTQTKMADGATLSGGEVRLNNHAYVNWICDDNGGQDDDTAQVDFGSLLSKTGALTEKYTLEKADGSREDRMVIRWQVDLDLSSIGDLTATTKFTITDTMDPGLQYIGPDPNGGYTNVASTLVDSTGSSVTISEPEVNGDYENGQTLTWTVTNLDAKQYTLTYYTEVTGEALNADNGNASSQVTNDAVLSQDGKEIGETSTKVNIETTLLDKDSALIQAGGNVSEGEGGEGYQVAYAIRVNPDKLDLLPASLEAQGTTTLTLEDTLPENTRVLNGVRFYDGDSYTGYDDPDKTEIEGCSASFSNDDEGRTVLTVHLPDETSVVVEYVLGILNTEQGKPVDLSNTVNLTGRITVSSTEERHFSYQMGDAYVTGTPGQITIYKLDDEGNALTGATFEAYAITADGVSETPAATATNENGGTYVLGLNEKLKLDTLYYWVESEVPTGYSTKDSKGADIRQVKHYVVLLDQQPTGDAWLAHNQAVLEAAHDADPNFEASDITFSQRYYSVSQFNTALETEIQLTAEKQLDGEAFTTANTFSFTLYDANGNELETKTNDATGAVTFTPLKYDFHDVEKVTGYTRDFTYIIKEKAYDTEEEAYIYDQSVYTVTVTVSLDQNNAATTSDDKLVATVTNVTKQANETAESEIITDHRVVFNNLTSKTSISGTKVWSLPQGAPEPTQEDITLTLYRYTDASPVPVEVPDTEYKFNWTNTDGDEWTWTYTDLTRFDRTNGALNEYTYFVTETLNAENGESYTYLSPVYTAPGGAEAGQTATETPAEETTEQADLAETSDAESAAETTIPEGQRAYDGYTITNRAVTQVAVNLEATKYYYGMREGQTFTFKLVNADKDGTEREGTGTWDGTSPIVISNADSLLPNDVTATATIGADHSGKIEFPEITYKLPGTYYYLMREVSQRGDTDSEYQLVNDPSSYLVRVDVKANYANNELETTVTYTWMLNLDGQSDREPLDDGETPAFYNNEIAMLNLAGNFIHINGLKQLQDAAGESLDMQDGQFRFYLYKENTNYTTGAEYLADTSLTPLASAETNKNGEFTFYYSFSDVPDAGITLAVVEENAGRTVDGITYSNEVGTVTLTSDLLKESNPTETVTVGEEKAEAFINTSALTIEVTKAWKDGDRTDVHHGPVTVYLMVNGERAENADYTRTLSAENSWTTEWTNLPVRDTDGEKITYTVSEEPVEFYTTTITEDTPANAPANTTHYTITNTFNAEGTLSIDPTVTKRVQGRDQDGTMTAGEFTFVLQGQGDDADIHTTAVNDAEGHVRFETLFYNEQDIGTHTYTITEVAGDDPHFEYDDSVITLTVEVARDETDPTRLAATLTYVNGETGEEQQEFVNTYYPVILAVQKTSKDGSNDPLPGAVYGLWMVSETSGEDVYLGNCVADENGYMYFRDGIQVGPRYYFKEEFAPAGHTVDEYPSVTFRIEKTDSGYELVYDGDNRLARNAPEPNADGQTAIDEDLQAIVLEFKDGAVGVQDEVTKLYVNKLDANTREPVTGAVLQIIEKDTGTVVYQWTSGEATQGMERVLNVDTAYILREVTAPEGYDKAEDTEFIFDAYGNLTVRSGKDAEWVGDTTINLYNTKRDVTITKQVTDEVVRQVRRVTHVVRTIPKTGDGAPILFVASLSLCGVLLIIYLQERKRANRRDR